MHQYDEREWSKPVIIIMVITMIIGVLSFILTEDTKHYQIELPIAIFCIILLVSIISNGSTRISVSRDGLKVQIGFLPFSSRTVPLNTISRIERIRIPWYNAKTQKGFFCKTERYAVTWGDAFTVYVSKGKPFIIQTKHREKILDILKRILPNLEIT